MNSAQFIYAAADYMTDNVINKFKFYEYNLKQNPNNYKAVWILYAHFMLLFVLDCMGNIKSDP